MKRRLLLYTRRNNVIRGPFPSKQITRHVLLGRLTVDDQVSKDQIDWRKISELPELVPEEINAAKNDPEAQEKLKLARYREDERLAGDRRDRSREIAKSNNRSNKERRDSETLDVRKHREVKTEILKHGKPNQNIYPLGFVLVFVAAVAAFAYFYKNITEDVHLIKKCDLSPRVGVNWSDCRIEGAVLNEKNLSRSKMRNVDMSGSEIKNANLSNSDLAYGNFSMVDFKYSNLSNTNMLGSVLRKANLSNTNMLNAVLSFSVLQEADLSYANLQNADLSNADLSGAIVTGVNFSGAKMDNTVWIDQRVCLPGSKGKCNLEKKPASKQGSVKR